MSCGRLNAPSASWLPLVLSTASPGSSASAASQSAPDVASVPGDDHLECALPCQERPGGGAEQLQLGRLKARRGVEPAEHDLATDHADAQGEVLLSEWHATAHTTVGAVHTYERLRRAASDRREDVGVAGWVDGEHSDVLLCCEQPMT